MAALICGAVLLSATTGTAHADPDTDFAAQLHTYGVYGPRDYNAWIGKLVCKRMYNGVDRDAYQSAKFVAAQLPKDSSTEQSWQFLAAAVDYYCPEKRAVLSALTGGSHA